MRKVYYIYNPKTRTYDRVYPTFRQRVIHILKRLFVGMGFGAGSFILLLWIFGSPSEKQLRIENSRLLAQYNVLSRRLDEALGVMQGIQQRDDNLYRVVLQADPVADAVRRAGYGGTNRYEDLMDMANADLVVNTTQKMDMLNRQLYIQSQSFDEVVDLFKDHDKMLSCIPAIQPVSNKNLKQTASGYGMRIDPIYKTAKFHSGMDFSANIGTPIYATGDGVVKKAGWQSGYGKIIIINHGFGYETWYAHLNDYDVRVGQKVKRGEVIGEVGNTGKSTGPHLHYEVHLKGKVMNPVNYYFMDLSAEDYDKMIELAANQGKVSTKRRFIMAYNPKKDLKMYYSIGEVAKMFDVNESLLRYWEKEFPIISPKKAGGNVRQYRKEDIENIRLVYHLVKEKGMTLQGAKQRLKANKEKTVQTAEVVDRLKQIREELVKLRKSLDYLT